MKPLFKLSLLLLTFNCFAQSYRNRNSVDLSQSKYIGSQEQIQYKEDLKKMSFAGLQAEKYLLGFKMDATCAGSGVVVALSAVIDSLPLVGIFNDEGVYKHAAKHQGSIMMGGVIGTIVDFPAMFFDVLDGSITDGTRGEWYNESFQNFKASYASTASVNEKYIGSEKALCHKSILQMKDVLAESYRRDENDLAKEIEKELAKKKDLKRISMTEKQAIRLYKGYRKLVKSGYEPKEDNVLYTAKQIINELRQSGKEIEETDVTGNNERMRKSQKD